MKKTELTFPEIALIAGTRGILGAGVGLLLADGALRTALDSYSPMPNAS